MENYGIAKQQWLEEFLEKVCTLAYPNPVFCCFIRDFSCSTDSAIAILETPDIGKHFEFLLVYQVSHYFFQLV